MDFVRLSYDRVTYDVDRDVSTAILLVSTGDEVHCLRVAICSTMIPRECGKVYIGIERDCRWLIKRGFNRCSPSSSNSSFQSVLFTMYVRPFTNVYNHNILNLKCFKIATLGVVLTCTSLYP